MLDYSQIDMKVEWQRIKISLTMPRDAFLAGSATRDALQPVISVVTHTCSVD